MQAKQNHKYGERLHIEQGNEKKSTYKEEKAEKVCEGEEGQRGGERLND